MKKYDSYKDSGVEWIGEVPEHWEVVPLKYLSDNFDSKRVPLNSAERSEMLGDYPYYGATGIVDYINNFLFDGKYVLIGEDGAPFFIQGKDVAFIAEGKFWVNNHAHILQTNDKILSTIFCYQLNCVDYKGYITGSTRDKLTQDQLKSIKLLLPTKVEQTIIANYLDHKITRIDHLIAKKEAFIQLLEEERVAVINQAVTKGLDLTVTMKDSGIEWLGEIPEHWEVKKLKYVANLKSGENITSEKIKEKGDYPVYGGNGLRGYYSEFTNYGDYILIGRQGALCGNIKYAKNRFWASEHAIVCYLESNINWLWFGKLLESMNLNQYNQSAAQPGLAVGVLKNLSIPFPKTEQQNKIVEFIIDYEKRTDNIIEKTKNEIGLLQEYKIALISEVVTGKVDIRT